MQNLQNKNFVFPSLTWRICFIQFIVTCKVRLDFKKGAKIKMEGYKLLKIMSKTFLGTQNLLG